MMRIFKAVIITAFLAFIAGCYVQLFRDYWPSKRQVPQLEEKDFSQTVHIDTLIIYDTVKVVIKEKLPEPISQRVDSTGVVINRYVGLKKFEWGSINYDLQVDGVLTNKFIHADFIRPTIQVNRTEENNLVITKRDVQKPKRLMVGGSAGLVSGLAPGVGFLSGSNIYKYEYAINTGEHRLSFYKVL